MNRFSTILLLLLATGLAIFVGTTHRWRFSPERTLKPGSPLFQFDPDDISSISFKNGDQSFRIQRKGEDWNLTRGMEDTASPEAVEALMRTALETTVLDRIDDDEIRDEKSLASYGLLKSSLQIDFKGDAPPSLLIGKTSPDGTRQYVAFENSKTVYLISSELVRLMTQPIEKFRDRRLLPISTRQIERVVFRKRHTALELQRNAGGWEILRPLKTPADDSAVEELLSKIESLRLDDFQAGINTDAATDSSQSNPVEAQFFTHADEASYLIHLTVAHGVTAHLEPRKISGTVTANATELLTPRLEKLRDGALLRINPDYVDVIRIEAAGNRREITRTREGWSQESPKVRDLSKNLALIKVAKRLPATPTEIQKCGLDAPQRRITFLAKLSENTPEATAGEQTVASLAIGKPLEDGSLPAIVEGTSEIRLVPGDLLEVLP
ncbi:MAG: DUF4340 domain-containing protein [bacterium]